MPKKKSAPQPSSGTPTLAIVIPLALVALVAWVIIGRGTNPPASQETTPAQASSPAPAVAEPAQPAAPEPVSQPAAAPAAAHAEAHADAPSSAPSTPQTGLPLPLSAGTTRPAEVVRAVYQFAADHPEVLSYVPCFCGCQHAGHRGNEDCFVKARDANGRVAAWEPHGTACEVCLDVGRDAMQMYASGASVRDIRAAIERTYRPKFPTMTPTPVPQ